MYTRAYSGARIRYARFVAIEGGALEIVNILCLARPQWPLPILGVDLVDLGRGAAIAAADLSPVIADHPAPAVPLTPVFAPAGELPGWCARWFSPYALFARVSPEQQALLAERVNAFCRVFAKTAATAPPQAASAGIVAERQAAYAAAHLDEDRGLQLLTRMFEPSLATRFLEGVLFPRGEVTWT